MYNSTLMLEYHHIYSFRPNLRALHSDSSELSEAVTRASNLAESVSGKVRILDIAKVCIRIDSMYILMLIENSSLRKQLALVNTLDNVETRMLFSKPSLLILKTSTFLSRHTQSYSSNTTYICSRLTSISGKLFWLPVIFDYYSKVLS